MQTHVQVLGRRQAHAKSRGADIISIKCKNVLGNKKSKEKRKWLNNNDNRAVQEGFIRAD